MDRNKIVKRFIRIVLCGLISVYYMGGICQSGQAADCNLNSFLANSLADQAQAAEITLAPGRRMFYEYPLHLSVGVSCQYVIEDDTIVKLAENKEVYKQPERLGIPGADAATGTFFFEAVKPGRTVVTLQHLFRGSIEKEIRVNVVVAE